MQTSPLMILAQYFVVNGIPNVMYVFEIDINYHRIANYLELLYHVPYIVIPIPIDHNRNYYVQLDRQSLPYKYGLTNQ